MTDYDDQDVLLDEEENNKPDKNKPGWRVKIFGILVVAFITIVTVLLVQYYTKTEEENFEAQLQQRMQIVVQERADIVATWLDGLANQSRSIVQSDLFRLFAAEIDLAGGDISSVMDPSQDQKFEEQVSEQPSYRDQIPYMVRAVTDLVKDTDYTAAYMVDRKGNSYLTSTAAPSLSDAQKAFALQVFDAARTGYSAVRESKSGLELDIAIPVFPTQFMEADKSKVIGVFIFTVEIAKNLNSLMQPNPISGLEGEYRLFQHIDADKIEEVKPLKPAPVAQSNFPAEVFNQSALDFADRSGIDKPDHVYSYGAKIDVANWILVWETPYVAARKYLEQSKLNVSLLALFFVLSFIAAFGAFWWRTNSDHNKDLAKQFADFARKIKAQKGLLDSVNNNIQEFIGLKSEDGRYSYVNPAFAKGVGKDIDEVVGTNDESIFGHGTAVRLKKLDQMALSTEKPVQIIDEIYLQGEKRHLQISKVPLITEREGEKRQKGIVTVARDITDLVQEQEKREKSIKQTVSALVRAVELRDPHLAGHSRRVADLAVMVAQDVSTDERVRRAIEIAANLSQIGKLDIPKEILTVDRRLTDEEIKIMQQHILNAEKIISEIEFDVPVLPAISQMYERLDGSGYPRGLTDEDIGLEGRILGVCDYFIARIEPRSYRAGISPDDALNYLEQSSNRYDPKVVKALKYVVHSTTGEKIIASVGGKGAA